MRLFPAALLLLGLVPLSTLQGQEPSSQPGRTSVLHGQVQRTFFQLPELGLEIEEQRQVLPDGTVSRTAWGPDGAQLDLDALRRQDHALGLTRRGGMSPTLFERVATMSPEETLEVAFWLVEPDDQDLGAGMRSQLRDTPRQLIAAATRAARQQTLATSIARHRTQNAFFAERVAQSAGEVVLVADAWPLVIARLSADGVRALARDPAVDEAYVSQPEWLPEGDYAQGTLRTQTVWAQGLEADGSVRVMVNDTAQVQTDNPYLPPIVTLNSIGTGSHATGVAGNIANTHPLYQASNHAIPQLYSAGGSGDSAAPPLWSAAIAAGVDFGNCSWWNGLKGSIQMLDRFFDYTVRTFGVMMFKSTGNQGNTSAPYTTTPGNGFNVINSGAYSDDDDVAWSGDAMASSSSYWDPAEGHEKPEVASPGTCVNTTGTGSSGLQACFGGTSSASPLTCGVAALVAAGDNTLLSQMTTVKATLMASAWHNVEGSPVLSEYDGAGGIHAAAAWALVRDQHWWYDDVEDNDFSGNVLDIPVELKAGDETRVVALWFGNANSAYTTDVLDMDLDMTILAPDSSIVTFSLHPFNPFEIVAFTAATSGTYTVRLTRVRFDGSSEPLSVAWSTKRDTAQARVALAPTSAPFAVGETVTLQLSEPYEGANKTYVVWPSLSGAPGKAMGSGYTQPIGFDWFSKAYLPLPGFVGVLDTAGNATLAMPIPNVLEAIGVPIHFAMIVVGPGIDLDDIDAIADDTVMVIEP